MKKIFFTLTILAFCIASLHAQHKTFSNGAEMCSYKKSLSTNLVGNSFRSPNAPKHAFDVLKYTLNIDLVNCLKVPYPNGFEADVKVLFRVDTALNQIVLDANNQSLNINGVQSNGISFTHVANKLTIQLDRTYNPGEEAEVHIFYTHADIYDGAFYASDGFVFTDSEPEGARKWFPCYDKPSDKATTDITAKVPVGARLGSNGKLQDSIVDGNTISYHWVSRDPVATYLTVLTASNNFNLDIVNWTNPNTSEVIPIRFYYNNLEDPSYIKSIIGDMTTLYSTKFGDHPFEKNGFATLNDEFAWGGMENQTLTSLCPNCWSESLVAHEFAHQWFGDMITCATWADLFLNEGFATWTEAYWFENRQGYAFYKNKMYSYAQNYFNGNPHWAISSPSWAVTTPSVNVLFNYSITYMKGSCVMHMLRYTLGDSVFFPALKAYATDTIDFKFKSATIEDFKNKMEVESGQELDWFFDQWIYKPDHPIYRNVYGITSGEKGNWMVHFAAKQEEQAFLPYFQMPLELLISFDDGSDSLLRVFNSFNGQVFAFEFDKEPVLVEFDPNNDILLKAGSTITGKYDEIASKQNSNLSISPNPFLTDTKAVLNIEKPIFATLELYNSIGVKIRTISEKYYQAGIQFIEIESDGLKNGIYFVVLRTANHAESVKIIKAE